MIALAESLFNLQGVDGIQGRVKQLRHTNVETTVAELEGAKLLHLSGRAFRFVAESGRRGSDFDIAVSFLDGTVANCESKCKVEGTQPSVGTLFDTLEQASSQLPNGSAAAFFVKIPESWPADPTIQAVMAEALAKAAALSNAPGLIVFHWEQWTVLEAGAMARAMRYRPELNGSARAYHPDFSRLIAPIGRWRYLLDVLRDARV